MKKQISAALYLIPVILLIAAVVSAGIFGSRAFNVATNLDENEINGQYFTLKKGKATVEITQTGILELYAIHEDAYGVSRVPTIGLKISIVNTETKEELVASDEFLNTVTLPFEGLEGRQWEVLEVFDVEEKGIYEISILDASGKPLEGEFFIGSLAMSAFMYIIAAILSAILLGIASIISFIVIAVARGSRKNLPVSYAPPYSYAPSNAYGAPYQPAQQPYQQAPPYPPMPEQQTYQPPAQQMPYPQEQPHSPAPPPIPYQSYQPPEIQQNDNTQ